MQPSENFSDSDNTDNHIASNRGAIVPQTLASEGSLVNDASDLVRKLSLDSNAITPGDSQDLKWSSSLQNLLDRPPAKLPRHLMFGGAVFIAIFGLWSGLGHVEEIGHASGKLVPQGETYKIHPVESGKVSGILVEEGDAVRSGQLIARLETDLAEQEVARLDRKIADYQSELLQKQGLLERLHLEAGSNAEISAAETKVKKIALADAEQKAAIARQLLARLRLEKAAYQQQQALLQPLLAVSQERLVQLEEEAKAHRERLRRLEPLAQDGAVSLEYVFNAEQSLRKTQQETARSTLQEVAGTQERLFQITQTLRELDNRIVQSEGDLAASLSAIELLETEVRQKLAQEASTELEAQQRSQKLEVEITQLKSQLAEAQALLASAQTKLERSFLRAQVDGVISSLKIENEGEVVQPGQTVAEIAPEESPLVLSAALPSTEAGFVEVGMEVHVKMDAYPYQDYGIVSGKVLSISPDAIADEQLGIVYMLEVVLAQDYVIEDREKVAFQAGQTAVADVIIRRRRLAAYLLDPIRKLREDGINL